MMAWFWKKFGGPEIHFHLATSPPHRLTPRADGILVLF
jgi:hypothetical protein